MFFSHSHINSSVARTSVGYKQLTERRMTFLVLPTFTFPPPTNPSLLFINSSTILNLHLCLGTTSFPVTTTLPTFTETASLLKLLQLYSRRLSKYSWHHTDQNARLHFAAHISTRTNHSLQLLQYQFLTQFYFHDVNFSNTINKLALQRLTHHHHIRSTKDGYFKHFQLQTKQSTTL